jgi:fumarate reductase subunit C
MKEIYRTRRYRKPVSPFWWLQRRSYIVFALRELSCLFIAWFVVFLLLLVSAVDAGEDRYNQFLTMAARPWMWLLNVIALLFVLLHAITWFYLMPQAIVLRVRGKRVARIWTVAFLYLCWIVLSWIICWIVVSR